MPASRGLAAALALVAGCNAFEPGGIDFWLSRGSRSMHELVAIDTAPPTQLLAANLDADAISELVAVRVCDVVAVRPGGAIARLLDLDGVVALRWNDGELLAVASDDGVTSRLVRARCDEGVAPCRELDDVALPDHTSTFELADLDHDGALDLLTRDDRGLAWSSGADGVWGSFVRFADAPEGGFSLDNPYATSIATGDIDGDGTLDVATVDEESGVLVFLGAAARDDAPLVLGERDDAIHLLVVDVTGDGIDDLVADQSDHTWVFHRSDGQARRDVVLRSESYYPFSVMGELDDSPGRDFVILSDGAPQLVQWHDGGWRSSTLAVSEPMQGFLPGVVAGDFDGDGRDDFAFARPAVYYEAP